MLIGDVAERLGIPASTIRYYEKVGLIEPQRRVSGRRSIDRRAISTLQFIQLAQAAGFTIAEMRTLLECYAKDPSPRGTWKTIAEGKKAAVRSQMKQLRQMDRLLTEFLKCDCSTITKCVERAGCDSRVKKRE